jgi:hypothetical protein
MKQKNDAHAQAQAEHERRIARSNADIARLKAQHAADVAKWLEELAALVKAVEAEHEEPKPC